MNTAVIRIISCLHCPYCSHSGMLQTRPKYTCEHTGVFGRNKVNAKYWYDSPILANHSDKLYQIDIPDWCPIKEV